ncbi:MAG: type II secretion protein F [Micrococcales bacterium]|nr:type II secretion protein F [Micrococcales bacterium]
MTWLVVVLVTGAVLVASGPVRRVRVERAEPSSGAAGGPSDLAAVVAGVAARLRAGARAGEAWSHALGTPVGDDGPDVARLVTVGERPRARRDGRTTGAVERARAVVAANQVAAELGAPLAPVLDTVAAALAADAEAEGDLNVALAGPRASARLVGWLPVLGLGLGLVVGADPVAVLAGGGLGSVAGVAGLLLLVVGRVWIKALVERARRWQG